MATFTRANPTFSKEALATGRFTTTTTTATGLQDTAGAAVVGAADQPVSPASSAAGATAVAVSPAAFHRVSLPPFAIDVSENAPPPTIVRDGREVTAPVMDPAKVGDFLIHTVPIVRLNLPVAIRQSIPAGTRVAKGTPVDVVLATVSNIPFNVFTGIHQDFATKSVADVLPIVADAQVAPLLDKDPTTLTDAQKAVVTTALGQKGITVVDTDPTRTFNLAFASLQSARAFQ